MPIALTLVGFGWGVPKATAQTLYPFSASYNVSATYKDIGSGVSEVSLVGESTDALYGLTKISGTTYSLVELVTGLFRFNTDPTTFGLQEIPFGLIVFSGSGNDKLFGTDSATGVIDFETFTATAQGIFTITGGEGQFRGATGILDFSEVDQLSLDPTVPLTGRAVVSGTFQVKAVPEPTLVPTLVALGGIGSGFLLRRRHQNVVRP